jgi:hypothetical protein
MSVIEDRPLDPLFVAVDRIAAMVAFVGARREGQRHRGCESKS